MIPSLKKVEKAEGTTVVPADVKPETVEGKPAGWYRITLNGEVKVEAADEDGAHYAAVTIDNLKRNAGGATVPNAVIEDWPDLPYRGIMLDVSRDFTSKDNLLKLIDLLDHYKVNRLHLHLGDDEGWRVEIAGLPELTSYGAYRGIPVLNEDGTISEPDALMPTYCVTPDRNDKATLGNGYYTKADFIEILRYAADRRIAVIPEFDMPGHSRAAIKSMEYRARTTGDASMLLSEPEDVSEYNSA
ncbi:MAG: family 20 glycosylhydrolase, partial [Bacteroidales bacterium]|nr:family 20 glycosylhydrolase [Bacteroidales bacterium]